MPQVLTLPDVYSAAEIARAAGVSVRQVRALGEAGIVLFHPGGFAPAPDAVQAIRILRGQRSVRAWTMPVGSRADVRLAGSAAVHMAFLGVLVLWSALGSAAPAPAERLDPEPVRLVFLAIPGPGGGGGGGGESRPKPATRARLKERKPLASPVVAAVSRREPQPEPAPKRPEPPRVPAEPPVEMPRPEPVPAVVAPVVPAAADPETAPGVVTDAPSAPVSRGSGTGTGSGSGDGSGLGEGSGPGIGPGSGGGTGGGPYRPGSGVTPPSLLHEVRPDYTEEARRRGISGEVVLEIVVRSDGRVGDVRLVRGLGAGLDGRAIEAVRQWRFSPARRLGSPVDVLVEVAVEFRLR